jgi:hypothetical protein
MHLRYHAGLGFRHAATAVFEAALIIAIVAALAFWVALATGGNPGGAGSTLARGGSDIWIQDTAARSGGLDQGEEVSFGFKTSYWDADGGTGPWLQLQCFRDGTGWEGQNDGVRILSASRAGFEGGWGYGVPFELASSSWHEGPADCTGFLGHKSKSGKWMTEATVGFHVGE